jgi:hypothetical protein
MMKEASRNGARGPTEEPPSQSEEDLHRNNTTSLGIAQVGEEWRRSGYLIAGGAPKLRAGSRTAQPLIIWKSWSAGTAFGTSSVYCSDWQFANRKSPDLMPPPIHHFGSISANGVYSYDYYRTGFFAVVPAHQYRS